MEIADVLDCEDWLSDLSRFYCESDKGWASNLLRFLRQFMSNLFGGVLGGLGSRSSLGFILFWVACAWVSYSPFSNPDCSSGFCFGIDSLLVLVYGRYLPLSSGCNEVGWVGGDGIGFGGLGIIVGFFYFSKMACFWGVGGVVGGGEEIARASPLSPDPGLLVFSLRLYISWWSCRFPLFLFDRYLGRRVLSCGRICCCSSRGGEILSILDSLLFCSMGVEVICRLTLEGRCSFCTCQRRTGILLVGVWNRLGSSVFCLVCCRCCWLLLWFLLLLHLHVYRCLGGVSCLEGGLCPDCFGYVWFDGALYDAISDVFGFDDLIVQDSIFYGLGVLAVELCNNAFGLAW